VVLAAAAKSKTVVLTTLDTLIQPTSPLICVAQTDSTCNADLKPCGNPITLLQMQWTLPGLRIP
jgi:hypothetical protein